MSDPLDPLSAVASSSHLPRPLSIPDDSYRSRAASSSSSSQVPNLSPLGKRPPLGLQGERTSNYRPQPLPPPPSSSAWSAPSPTRGQGAGPVPARNPPGDPHSPRRPGSVSSGGMTPRSPQAYSSPVRDRMDRDDRLGSSTASDGTRGPPPEPFVRIRIMGLEKNRRDVYIKFNAESNLPTFRNSTYRAVSRAYSEYQKFSEAIAANCPQSIVPALPLVQTSAPSEEEDDRLIKAAFQKWVARITLDPAIMRDEELRSFIESEFGYTATTRARRKMPPTFHFPRGSRLPGEQDDDLTLAKAAMAKLEVQFAETAKAVEKVARARRAVAVAYVDVGEHLNTFATTEPYQPLANGIKKLSRTTKLTADIMAAQATSEMVTLGDALNYQSSNARNAKDTLASRDVILNEHRDAAKATIAKRRAIEKLRSSSSIKPDRVDEALEELADAKTHEDTLTKRLDSMSEHLEPSLRQHSVHAHQDVLTALLDHSHAMLRFEKQLLKELELVRPEVHAIKQPQPGVIYHASPAVAPPSSSASSATMGDPSTLPPRSSSTAAMASPSIRNGLSPPQLQQQQQQPGSPPSAYARSAAPPVGRGGPNFAEPGPLGPTSMATEQRKRSLHSMAKSVVVNDDRRQRVDAKMAASMLANGF